MKQQHALRLRPTPGCSVSVVAISSLAALGFIEGTPGPIIVAAVLALPTSLIAAPGYYVLFGLLALVPGANPSTSSGTGTGAADGTAISSVSSGLPAHWFTVSTVVLGIVVLAAAAILNVLLARTLMARRKVVPSQHEPDLLPTSSSMEWE